MRSRRAKILIPLAVELAFAIIIGVIIVATDGGRYGLGAKGALERLTAAWARETYAVTVTDIKGPWSGGSGDPVVDRWPQGRVEFFLRRGHGCAGLLEHEGQTWFWTQAEGRGTLLIEDLPGTGQETSLALPPFDAGSPWQTPFLCQLLLHEELGNRDPLAGVSYVELVGKTGDYGERHDVLVLWRKRPWRELWAIGPVVATPSFGLGAAGLRACVFLDAEEPHTELYFDVLRGRLVRPLDAEIFEGGTEGLRRLREWIEDESRAPRR